MDDTLRDETDDGILDTESGRQEVIDRISKPAPKVAKAKSGDDGNAIKKKFDELKAAAGDGGDSDEDLSECSRLGPRACWRSFSCRALTSCARATGQEEGQGGRGRRGAEDQGIYGIWKHAKWQFGRCPRLEWADEEWRER